MLSFTHTIISLPLALYLDNPILILAASVLMHFLADTILHWNIYPYRFKRYPVGLVALDVIGGLVAAWWLLGDAFFTLPVLLAIAGGNAPDVVHGLWDILRHNFQHRSTRILETFFVWHDKLQLETTHPLPGLLPQVVLIVGAILLLVVSP